MENGTTRTTCSYCSVGCNIEVQIENGKATKVLPAKEYPVNLGKTCTKGFNLLKAYEAPDRALYPMLRDENDVLQRVSWDVAAKKFVDGFRAVQEKHGKESVAFISTGQMVIEEMALLGAFAKFGMGVRHGDGNTRQCMASAVVAYKQAFGFDAPPFTYKDAEESDLLIFVGSNPMIAHPILWQRVKMNKRNPTIVVVDPRKTETAAEATVHLAIEPKTDMYLLYAVANLLIRNGQIRKDFIGAHTNGFEEFVEHVKDFTPELASEKTGLNLLQIADLARLIASKKRVSFWWTMGVNQSHQGVRTIQAMINIALMTGNIGRPGTGANSITGQTNAMGSRLFSNTTNLIGGHDFGKPAHREKVSKVLGISEDLIPPDAGLAYDQILAGIDEGKIKGLWVICTNPGHTWIDKHTFYERMKKLDFLVVQDIYHSTETAKLADLMLPAGGSVEKNGTLINSERRMGIVQKVMDPPGEAKADFDIFHTLIDAWGLSAMFEKWKTTDDVFAILRELSRGQPCDITGVKDRRTMFLEQGGVQWPYPEAGLPLGSGGGGDWNFSLGAEPIEGDLVFDEAGVAFVGEDRILRDRFQRRLFEDGKFFHEDGRARFLWADVEPTPEVPDAEYPFWLLTGRGSMHQFHSQTRTSKVEILRKMYPQTVYVEISPQDAKRLEIADKEKVYIEGKRGAVVVEAMVKDSVRPGYLFMPMHYEETNYLTFPSFDSYSRQPSYKIGAVRIWRASSNLPIGALNRPRADSRK